MRKAARARELRRPLTPAEQVLWKLLRGRRLANLKFRRQSPLSIYVADFYCHDLKLIVELDGAVHADPRQKAHDENRDFYLRSLGCTIVRFKNEDVFERPEAVLEKILEVVRGL